MLERKYFKQNNICHLAIRTKKGKFNNFANYSKRQGFHNFVDSLNLPRAQKVNILLNNPKEDIFSSFIWKTTRLFSWMFL
jgi:hypothetical protein